MMTDRQGIEVDYCPQCRGVWLDRGELDKIIDRSLGAGAPSPSQHQQPEARQRDPESRPYSERRDHDTGDDDRYDPRKKKRSSGFLGELFDF